MRSPTERNRGAEGPLLPCPAEQALLVRLLDGEERAYNELVSKYQGAMLRLSRCYVPTWALAEEAVQETWAAVFDGMARFRGHSSLRSWIFAILTNRAKTLARRERRSAPLMAPTFREADDPLRDDRTPERSLQLHEQLSLAVQSINALPPAQREVVRLRCMLQRSAGETCAQLEISSVNQRVLLHRGRVRLRSAMARATRGDRAGWAA